VLVFQVLFFGLIVVLFIALILTRRRGLGRPSMMFPVNTDNDDPARRTPWFTSGGGSDFTGSGDSGSSSGGDGGSFGDGGGFSGGGSSDTI
jgi:hypothetical protein